MVVLFIDVCFSNVGIIKLNFFYWKMIFVSEEIIVVVLLRVIFIIVVIMIRVCIIVIFCVCILVVIWCFVLVCYFSFIMWNLLFNRVVVIDFMKFWMKIFIFYRLFVVWGDFDKIF